MSTQSAPIYEKSADYFLAQMEQTAQKLPEFADPQKKFDDALATITDLAGRVHGLTLICSLSTAYLTSFAHIDFPEFEHVEKLGQGHIELLQALILKFSTGNEYGLATTGDYTATISSLTDLFIAFPLKRLNNMKTFDARAQLSESIRTHTQGVRNLGYPQQLLSLTKGIFDPISELCVRHFGVSFSALAQWFFNIESLIEGRINQHFLELAPVMVATTHSEVLNAILTLYPDQSETLKTFLEEQQWTTNQLKAMTYAHRELRLPDVYTLSIDDLISCFPSTIDQDTLRKIADRLSLEPKAASLNKPVDHLFMSNPVCVRPFLKREGNWVLPIPALVVGSCLNMLESLAASVPDLKEAEERQRGKFLEKEAIRLLKNAFPTAQVIPNARFDRPHAATGEPQEGESDVVVLLPPYLVVVNCKGKRLSPEARRGAPSLKEEIAEMIVEPANQSRALVDELRKQKQLTLSSPDGNVIIDAMDYSEAIPLSVVLDSLCPLTSNIPSLVEAGYVSKDSPRAPVMTITDLECVLEILPTESQRLHYFVMRDIIEREAPFISDELGLLRIYLDNSLLLPIPDLFREIPLIDMYGTAFDPYFMQQWSGNNVARPEQQLTPWTRTLLNFLEKLKPPQWREVGQCLLHLGAGTLQEVENKIRAVRDKVRENPQDKPNNVLRLMCVGRPELPAVLFFVHPLVSHISAMMQGLAMESKELLKVSKVAVLWFNSNSEDCRIWAIGVHGQGERQNGEEMP